MQLELEWLGAAGADAARLSDDKLRAYTAVLKEQAAELQSEVHSLRFHPRYATLVSESPWGIPVLLDGPSEQGRLDAVLEQLDAALERLRSADAIPKCAARFASIRTRGSGGGRREVGVSGSEARNGTTRKSASRCFGSSRPAAAEPNGSRRGMPKRRQGPASSA